MLYFPPPFKFCGNFGDADDDDIQVGLTPSSELEYRSRGDGPWLGSRDTKNTCKNNNSGIVIKVKTSIEFL